VRAAVLGKVKKLCHGLEEVVLVASVVFGLLSAVLSLAVVLLQTVLVVRIVLLAVRVAKTVWLFVAVVGVFAKTVLAGYLEPEPLGLPRQTADWMKSLHARYWTKWNLNWR